MKQTAIFLLILAGACATGAENAPEGWTAEAVRDETRPAFDYTPTGGPEGGGVFHIIADGRPGLDGRWVRTFPVEGGKHYRFFALRRLDGVASPRRSALARVIWQGPKGETLRHAGPGAKTFAGDAPPVAEPEYPLERSTRDDGWT